MRILSVIARTWRSQVRSNLVILRLLHSLRSFAMTMLIVLLFSNRLYAVIGDEEISSQTLEEIRREHEEEMEEEEKKEEEKRAQLIRVIEEKQKKAAEQGESAGISETELAKLKSEALLKKKRFRERIHITPFERFVFDSNVRNQKEAKSDIIFNTGSGVQLDLGTERTKFNVDYIGLHADYWKNRKLSRFEHQLGTLLRYPISSKSEVEASYKLSSTGNQTSEIRNILRRLKQDAGILFKQRISSKTGFRLNGVYSDTFFRSSSTRDNSRRQFVFGPELNYFVSRKTSLFTRYALGFSSGGVNERNKAIANEFRGGIRGKLAPKTTALLDLGYSHQKLKTLGGNANAFVAEVVIISNLTRKSRVELLINRSFSQSVETVGTNFYVTENYRLSGTTQFRRFLMGQIFSGLRRNTFDQGGRISGSDQRDLILEVGGSLRYDFRKWLGFELRYVFSGADSTNEAREYAKHVASFAVNGRY